MYEVFADLHVHLGRSENGKPIIITAARSLNFANIAKECAERKGINIVGIIDCASPYVIEDIEKFLQTGEAYELKDGGIIYKDILESVIRESCVMTNIFLKASAGDERCEPFGNEVSLQKFTRNDTRPALKAY